MVSHKRDTNGFGEAREESAAKEGLKCFSQQSSEVSYQRIMDRLILWVMKQHFNSLTPISLLSAWLSLTTVLLAVIQLACKDNAALPFTYQQILLLQIQT